MSKMGLVVTSRCNFTCRHCIKEGASIQDIDLELLDSILKQAAIFHYNTIHLTGGEPCLHPAFKRLVEVVVQNGFKFSIGSNGYLLREYEFLLGGRERIDHFSTSLDGLEKTHDAIRTAGSYQKVLEYIDFYSARGIPVNVVMTLNSLNRGEMEAVAAVLLEHGAANFYVGGIIPTRYNQALALSDEEKYDLFLQFKQLKAAFKQRLEMAYTASLYRGEDLIDFCRAISFNQPMINPYGEMLFCCDTLGNGAAIGSLRENSFEELLNKGLDYSTALKKNRILDIRNKNFGVGFNSCAWCNDQLERCIHY